MRMGNCRGIWRAMLNRSCQSHNQKNIDDLMKKKFESRKSCYSVHRFLLSTTIDLEDRHLSMTEHHNKEDGRGGHEDTYSFGTRC